MNRLYARPVNRDEAIAEIYLRTLGLGEVIYEPDGNHTPDFLIDGRIAVEVRRLNQHSLASGEPQGLETVEAALARFIDNLLPRLGPATDGVSWWVSYHFWRPLDLKAIKRDLPRVLSGFAGTRSDGRQTILLQSTFEVDLQPTTHPHDTRYLLAAYSDYEAGGFIGAEIIRNSKLCIAEKAAKIATVKHRYPEWWLLLVDRIGPELNDFERNDLPNHFEITPWDRVVLLDPNNPLRALPLGKTEMVRIDRAATDA